MSSDRNQPCPCGSGKKLKFCCCGDIANDVAAVVRMCSGDQRLAALEKLNRLIADKGERAALLALKALVLFELNEMDQARSVIGTFVVQHPDNAVALALSALLETTDGNLDKAIMTLQRAIERSGREVEPIVMVALLQLALQLAQQRRWAAALSHFRLAAQWDESEESSRQMLQALMEDERIPLLYKEKGRLALPPEGAAWSQKLREALELSAGGAWLAAAERMEMLAQEVPNEPAILKNIAVLRTWLGIEADMAPAWHRYAQLESTPLEDAVEAEAMAQLCEGGESGETVDVVQMTFPVKDTQRMLELLASDRRVDHVPLDLSQLAKEDQPPPRGVYRLLDRPKPTSGVDITLDRVPHVVGHLTLYGKETDREARLELAAAKTSDLPTHLEGLQQLVGDAAGPPAQEEVIGRVDAVSLALTANWCLPQDTPVDQLRRLRHAQYRQFMLERWPQVRLKELGGRRPCDVAEDPAYRVRLLAAILLLELRGLTPEMIAFDHNELRAKLGLPLAEDIDGSSVKPTDLPLARLHRVVPETADDPTLASLLMFALSYNAVRAIHRIVPEVLRRPGLEQHCPRELLHLLAARTVMDFDEALAHARKAQTAAIRENRSPAAALLLELDLRLQSGRVDRCPELVQEIQQRHGREPGVMERLLQILASHGVLRRVPEEAESAGREQAPVAASAQPAAADGLWTPGSPSGFGGEQKPGKLWLPGQD